MNQSSELNAARYYEYFALYPSPAAVTPLDLKNKLHNIYSAALEGILKVEEGNLKKLTKMWGDSFPGLSAEALDGRIDQWKELTIDKNEYLILSYQELLQRAHILRRLVRDFAKKNKKAEFNPSEIFFSDKRGKSVFDVVHHALNPTSLESIRELDLVLSSFFDLQVGLYFVGRWRRVPPGVPLDEGVRAKRASAGGRARNSGDDLLRAMMVAGLRTVPEQNNVKSLNKFLSDNYGLFVQIFEEYKRIYVVEAGDPARYGVNLKPENINEKISAWCKEFLDIRLAISRVIPDCDLGS